jgi:hypothetical protein
MSSQRPLAFTKHGSVAIAGTAAIYVAEAGRTPAKLRPSAAFLQCLAARASFF